MTQYERAFYGGLVELLVDTGLWIAVVDAV